MCSAAPVSFPQPPPRVDCVLYSQPMRQGWLGWGLDVVRREGSWRKSQAGGDSTHFFIWILGGDRFLPSLTPVSSSVKWGDNTPQWPRSHPIGSAATLFLLCHLMGLPQICYPSLLPPKPCLVTFLPSPGLCRQGLGHPSTALTMPTNHRTHPAVFWARPPPLPTPWSFS